MNLAWYILGLYALVLLAALAGLVYLIFRRRRVKKQEHFEKRSN